MSAFLFLILHITSDVLAASDMRSQVDRAWSIDTAKRATKPGESFIIKSCEIRLFSSDSNTSLTTLYRQKKIRVTIVDVWSNVLRDNQLLFNTVLWVL